MRKSLPVTSYQHRSRPASSARLVNCFAEALPPDAKTPIALIRSPGISSWTTVGSGPIHAMKASNTLLYVVTGTKLYSVNESKTATLLGDIGPVGSNHNVDIEINTDSVVVTNHASGAYVWNGSSFAAISDPDFPGGLDVEFIDNYLTFVEPDSGRFFAAELGSATSFDALDFATAESSPDNLVGHKADHGQLILAGKTSIEIWQNTGAAGFPFERAANGRIEIGCANGKTLAKLDNSVVWVANDYTVRRLEGLTPARISHHGIEQALTDVTMASGRAYSYSQDGHLFYVLMFTERTLVYDATTQLWHERQSHGYDYWRAKSHAQFAGVELVGDATSNKIGYLNPEAYDEWGDIQRMEWTYQPIYADGRRAIHDRLEVICEAGVGLSTGQGSDPQMMMEYSDDGGITFQSLPNRSLGAIGRYTDRMIWNGCGSSYQRVYRGAVSDPVKVVISDTQAEVRGGRW